MSSLRERMLEEEHQRALHKRSDTAPVNSIVVTPLIASVLTGWSRGGHEGQGVVLGAVLSAVIEEECAVELCGSEGRHAILTLYGDRNMHRVGELTRFLLEVKDCEGEDLFDIVSVNIREYQKTIR